MVRFLFALAVLGASISPTQSQSGCHPSYDPCVPIALDVDCAGGNGDGPEYVAGPIRVKGPDVYDLDRDNDGIGCEPQDIFHQAAFAPISLSPHTPAASPS